MNKSLISTACTSIFALSALSALADGPPTTCSLATLQGTYAFAGTGTDYGTPYTTSGRETYDGHGHIKHSQLLNEGGVTYTYTGTGTYTMSSDCVASASYGVNNTNRWTYFVAPDGSVFSFNNNTGVMSAGHENRISRAPLF